jgi:hypothetical protein
MKTVLFVALTALFSTAAFAKPDSIGIFNNTPEVKEIVASLSKARKMKCRPAYVVSESKNDNGGVDFVAETECTGAIQIQFTGVIWDKTFRSTQINVVVAD